MYDISSENFVKNWALNAHKYLIWLSDRHLIFDKGRQFYEESCITFL